VRRAQPLGGARASRCAEEADAALLDEASLVVIVSTVRLQMHDTSNTDVRARRPLCAPCRDHRAAHLVPDSDRRLSLLSRRLSSRSFPRCFSRLVCLCLSFSTRSASIAAPVVPPPSLACHRAAAEQLVVLLFGRRSSRLGRRRRDPSPARLRATFQLPLKARAHISDALALCLAPHCALQRGVPLVQVRP
jgi:hypothetical protein